MDQTLIIFFQVEVKLIVQPPLSTAGSAFLEAQQYASLR